MNDDKEYLINLLTIIKQDGSCLGPISTSCSKCLFKNKTNKRCYLNIIKNFKKQLNIAQVVLENLYTEEDIVEILL